MNCTNIFLLKFNKTAWSITSSNLQLLPLLTWVSPCITVPQSTSVFSHVHGHGPVFFACSWLAAKSSSLQKSESKKQEKGSNTFCSQDRTCKPRSFDGECVLLVAYHGPETEKGSVRLPLPGNHHYKWACSRVCGLAWTFLFLLYFRVIISLFLLNILAFLYQYILITDFWC